MPRHLVSTIIATYFLITTGTERQPAFASQNDGADLVHQRASCSAFIISITVSGRNAFRTCGRLMVILVNAIGRFVIADVLVIGAAILPPIGHNSGHRYRDLA